MAINFVDLFDRLGNLIGIVKAQIDLRTDIITRVENTDGYYVSSNRYMLTPVLNYFNQLSNATDTSIDLVIATAIQTLVETVVTDNPSVARDLLSILRELQRQMIVSGESLPSNSISLGVVSYGGSNIGDGKIFLNEFPTVENPSETLVFQCIRDATNGAAIGSETFKVRGGESVSNTSSIYFPSGSGATGNLRTRNYVFGNSIQNGNFANFTNDLPDLWVLNSGNCSQETAGAFRNGSSLRIIGDPLNLSQILPRSICFPNRRLTFGFWFATIAGTQTEDVTMDLINTADSSVLASATAFVGDTSPTWQLKTASYMFSADAPVQEIAIVLSRAADAGVTFGIGAAFVDAPIQQGTNGQFVTILSGETDWRIGDFATVVVTNDNTAILTNYMERFFAPFARGIELPTSNSPTITDAVIP